MNARVPGVNIRYDAKRKLPWGLFIEVMIGGKRYSPSKFFATEAEAEACYPVAAAEVAKLREEAVRDGRLKQALAVPDLPKAPKGIVLFETIALRWLDEHVLEMCAAATYRNYKGLLDRHLLPVMRTWPCNDATLSKDRLKQLLKSELQEKRVSLPTRLACHACLSALFSWATTGELPHGQLTTNPVLGMGRYIRGKVEKEAHLKQPANPMTHTQAEAFLAWQQEHYPELYEWFVWLIDEGSRVGEVAALKWDRVDLAGGKAHIVEAFSEAERWMERKRGDHDGRGEKDTKTHRDNQYIDLSDRVREVLTALRARTRMAWMARGRYGKEPQHVFVTNKLTPRRPDKIVYRAFREGCEALMLRGQNGGKPFTIHCLRDTFATLSILDGKPIGWVAMMLGHANEKTTRDYYYKWVRQSEENLLSGIKR